ncbi:hypothetical protein CJF32_00007125 [Rutstroemia sp. NJR-2017a WRK4]|nr:hypothetical protein CJF32_00007125 [Rutstroemia sp. NJR-2017a WRK4]
MVILGGLELLAAGYLLNRHLKHKEEKQRLEIEALDLEERSYPIYSADDAGPRRSRRHSHDRERDRKERRQRRRDSPDWDRDRSRDRKHIYGGRERSRDREDRKKSQEDLRYSSPPKSHLHSQHRTSPPLRPQPQPPYPATGAPQSSWVPPPPPPFGSHVPPPTHPQYAPASHHQPSATVIPNPNSYPAEHPQPYIHPTFANEPYRYPPEKLPESLLSPPSSSGRGRSSSAPGEIYERPIANTSRVRIAVPGEDELTIPGEEPPPAYEEVGYERESGRDRDRDRDRDRERERERERDNDRKSWRDRH